MTTKQQALEALNILSKMFGFRLDDHTEGGDLRAFIEQSPEVASVDEAGMAVMTAHRKKNPNLYVPAFMRQALYTMLEEFSTVYPRGLKITKE